MKILIIGFQRSGTTLMRWIIEGHPDVKKIYHENFLLRQYKSKASLMESIVSRGVDPVNQNWGEKCPYYPNIRKIPLLKYCETWNQYFGNESRILHIVRHPIDVALSVLNKRKRGSINGPLKMYAKRMPNNIPNINNMSNVMTFKYEDVLMYPDDVLPKIFEFCGLWSGVDFRKYLKAIKKPKYQSLDGSRAFAYKRKTVKINHDLSKAIEAANKIEGPTYEI